MKPDSRRQQATQALQRHLGYTFRNPQFLTQALTHRSYSAKNNERFEFVGDAILDYSVAKILFDTFPDYSEGELSRLRANLVNQDVLAEIARSMGVGDALYLGVGELKSGGFDRPSILADAVEALLAAISFDTDFAAAEQTVRRLFERRIDTIDLSNQGKDPKTLLQEALQARRLSLPKYRIEHQSGEGNDARFDIACDLGELAHITYARASSRRAAEQAAAKEALDWLQQQHPLPDKPKKPYKRRA